MGLRELIIDTRKTNDRLRRENNALRRVVEAIVNTPEDVAPEWVRRTAQEVLKTTHA